MTLTRRAFTGGIGLAAAAITAGTITEAAAEEEPTLAARPNPKPGLQSPGGPYIASYPDPSPELHVFGNDPDMVQGIARAIDEVQQQIRRIKGTVAEALIYECPDHANNRLTKARNATNALSMLVSDLQSGLNQAIIDQRVLADLRRQIGYDHAAG